MSLWQEFIPDHIKDKYEIHNFNHAVEILAHAYPSEYAEIIETLTNFVIPVADIIQSGGNESPIPKQLSVMLRPKGWQEAKITGDLVVKLHRRRPSATSEVTIEDFIDSHNIDYVKNAVAVDMEWNSKDQTFDRDLYAFRSFYECNIISCGVIITRSATLNPLFSKLGIMQKYGASTTWMGKLLPRIHSGRHGGCPLLVVGITPNAVTGMEE